MSTNQNNAKLIFIGSDDFIENSVQSHIAKLEDPDEEVYFADEMDIEEFFAYVSTPSLFNPTKAAVVHSVHKLKNPKEFIEQCTRAIETCILLTAPIDAAKKIEKIAGEFKISVEKKMNREALTLQTQKIFEDKGLPCDYASAEEIQIIFGGDMKQVRSEAEKLSLYFAYKKPKDSRDLLALITSEKQENVFAFMDYFAQRNKKGCLRTLENLFKGDENLNILYVLLGRRMKQVYLEKKLPGTVKVQYFILKKLKADTARWKTEELSKMAGTIAEYDYKIKTGQLEIKAALIQLTHRL
ncbi:DNA polymerase III subunit delta [Limisalsivibrio acetivorans]|uniref:DNA polymerase III subunit delta n=1 Tax=Limisalsivibrio acetivorans TaxID=1304888 RepID=UPI0003B704EF|nr:hypothetical protein [Limisalsivibrio acetivorans]